MSPLVFIAAGAGLFLLMRGKSSERVSEMVGPSGKRWLVQTIAAPAAGLSATKVTVKAGQFGAHIEMPVLVFTTPAGASGPRTLVSWDPNATPIMLETAVKDFNVQVPEGLGAPLEE